MWEWGLAGCFFFAALLYASVGHAGASAYLAAMALFGLSGPVMKPTALVLNIVVATLTTTRYWRAGCFSWKTFWPFAVTSVPCAFIGGMLPATGLIYKPAVGVVLLLAAARLMTGGINLNKEPRAAPRLAALAWGAALGFASGFTGTGGGIMLSPLLLHMGWSDTRTTSGIASAFILLNSIAGLSGNLAQVHSLPAYMPLWLMAVVSAAAIGTELGSKRLNARALQFLLGVVLVIAGLKLIFVR